MRNVSFRYWRICWKYITPGLMTAILLYSLLNQEQLKDGDHDYPPIAHVVGYLISCLGLAQLPIFAVYAICKQKDESSIWMVTQLQLPIAFH